MKRLKKTDLKFMNKLSVSIGLFLAMAIGLHAQNDLALADSVKTGQIKIDSVKTTFKKIKIDGVSAVVGDYVILESDIDKNILDLENQGISTKNFTRCQILGKLMEDKLYAHQAIQDSIVVSDIEINSIVDRQVDYLVNRIGSIDKVLEFYNKNDVASFREELFELAKTQQLSDKMRDKIIDEIEITPEEVRQWYKKIPEDQRPVFGDEVEIAQIVKQPKASPEEVKKVIDKLNSFKRDIEENGASFKIKATLYSQDPAVKENQGFYPINKKSPFVKEFKDVAFSLQEGEISEPFETEFGWHILTVEKIRGQEVDVRHILLIPQISEAAKEEARKELDSIRSKIIAGEFTFEEAARNFSDEKETRFDGGVLRNPTNFDTHFELTKMDPVLYNQIRNLNGDEISQPLIEETRTGINYKLIKVISRFKEHPADYSQDYIKIQELALKEKQLNTIKKWMEDKIKDTYISVSPANRGCSFENNWLKQ